MKRINRAERYDEASTEIRAAMLLVGDMLATVERARYSAAKQPALTTEAMNLGSDIAALTKRIQTLLRPMTKTAEDRKRAEQRAARRRER